MTYNKTQWTDGQGNALNATNLNNIENGIVKAVETLNAHDGLLNTLDGRIDTLETTTSDLNTKIQELSESSESISDLKNRIDELEDHSHDEATEEKSGFMSPADKQKLKSLEVINIVNDLNSESTTSALSAAQGKALKEYIDEKQLDASSADMLKSTYDSNNDGVVNKADDSTKLAGHAASYYATATSVNNLSSTVDNLETTLGELNTTLTDLSTTIEEVEKQLEDVSGLKVTWITF